MAKGNPGKGAGVEVARLTVKVSPDTRHFRKELEDKLNSINKTLDGKDSTDVPMNADTSKIPQQVKRETSKLKASVEIEPKIPKQDRFQRRVAGELQAGMAKAERQIQLNFGGESFRRDIEKAAEQLDKLIKSPIPKDKMEAAARRSRISEEIEALMELGRDDPKAADNWLGVSDRHFQLIQRLSNIRRIAAEQDRKSAEELHKLRMSGWKDELRHMKLREDETRKYMDIHRNENPQIELQLDDKFDYKLRQRLSKIKPKIEVDPEIKQSKSSHMAGFFANMKGPSFGSGINMSGYAVILGAITLAAAPLIGLLTSALLTLPGLIAAVATPIAAITLGLDGFKRAAEQIKPQFEDLKTVMSTAAETSFGPVLRDIADNVFPSLKAALPGVTAGLAQMAQGVVDAIKDSPFETIINRISTMFQDLRPGFESMTSGLVGLVDGFSQKFPAITTWFNETMADFDAWVTKMSLSDELQASFGALGDTLRGILEMLGKMATEGLKFISNPEKMEGFLDVLGQIESALSSIVKLSNDIGKVWSFNPGNWVPAIESFLVEDVFGGTVPGGDKESGAKRQQWIEDLKESLRGISPEAQAAEDALNKVLMPPAVEQTAPGATDVLGSLQQQLQGAKTSAESPAAPTPNLEPAKAELTEYQGFVDQVTAQVRGSLEQATSGESLPAPNFDAFKKAWEELPQMVAEKGQEVVNESAKIPQAVGTSLAGMGGIGSSAGSALMSGLLGGMQAGEGPLLDYVRSIAPKIAENKGPIPFDKIILRPNGEALMEGLGAGMENGFAPVLDQAKGMAGRIADAFASGEDPTGLLSGFKPGEVDRMEKVLALEEKRLANQARALDYQAKSTGNEALKARADELRMQRDQISLQQDMLGLTQDYADEYSSIGGDDPFVKAASGLMNAPVDFAKATGQQFMSDLGISGDGLISRAITEGISYVFQIGSVDEAMSIKDREDSKRARAMGGR